MLRNKIDYNTTSTNKEIDANLDASTPIVLKENYRSKKEMSGGISEYSISEEILSSKKELTSEDLLRLHHLDPNSFVLVDTISNEWSVISKGEKRYNFQSKIRVKPMEFDLKAAIDYAVKKIKPYGHKERSTIESTDKYLVLPNFDNHFGSSSFETYTKALNDQMAIIKRGYHEILIVLGGDILHVDNINSTTTRGTQLDTTNVVSMIDEANKYFEPLIECALLNAQKVKVISVSGNHDATLSYLYAKILQAKYGDDIEWDINLYDHYKATLLGHNMIAVTHGDKAGVKRYVSIFADQFPELWVEGKNRELLVGHLHFENDLDLGGLFMRQFSTLKPTDQWTKDNGFTSRKSMSVIEYNEYGTSSITYVG